MSKFPVSYSRLNTFKTCPRQFEFMYILKSVKDEGSDATRYGERVHKSLEMYGKTGDAAHLTAETIGYRGYVDTIRAKYPQAVYEMQGALNFDLEPCGWFDSDVWIRGILDVSIIDGTEAVTLDWKTGKVRPDQEQFRVFATLVFKAFPQVQKITSTFVWLKFTEVTTMVCERSQAEDIWKAVEKRINLVQEAVDTGVFKAKPSPLCGWCAAQEVCSDAQRKRR